MNPLEKPYYELEQAKSYLDKMRASKSLEDFEENWKHYLIRLERVWYKFLAVNQKHPKWDGWGGKHINVKKKDPLLSYLKQARGADEHNVTEITESTPGSTAINPAQGNVLKINYLSINNGKILVDSDQPLKITFTPAKMRLLPVTNQSTLFPVPTSHLNNPIDPDDIIGIGEMGIDYYSKMLEDSKKVFV